MNFYKLVGALGLTLIIIGAIMHKRRNRDIFYFVGGILLEVYSIYIKDIIFIVLQLVFILVIVYDFLKNRNSNN